MSRTRTRATVRTLTHHLATRPAFALLAALSVTALAGCGSSSDPSTVAAPPSSATTINSVPGGAAMSGHDMTGMAGHTPDPGKGLLVSEKGFTLKPTSSTLKTGAQTVSFQILKADGKPLTQYTVDATKLLHFYLVRQDLSGFQHLHPTLRNGTWSIAVKALTPGPYRMYTDFIGNDAAGTDTPVVLSTTLTVPGSYTPTALAAPAASTTVDGLTATMTGSITAGAESKVNVTVTQNGKPVTDLDTYLDSFAHMTALHVGDLVYQHIHPGLEAKPGQRGGPELPFEVDLPEKGTWKLFLQVQRAGTLHLLPLTVTVK
ncbi:MAG: hypothetical protein NVS3B26_22570 [Mycobacteriales bacterium]